MLLRALEEEAGLSAIGRFSARELVLGLLSTRLRLTRLLDAHPEIENERLAIDLLLGRGDLRQLLEQGTPHIEAEPLWRADLDAFVKRRERYLLYR